MVLINPEGSGIQLRKIVLHGLHSASEAIDTCSGEEPIADFFYYTRN